MQDVSVLSMIFTSVVGLGMLLIFFRFIFQLTGVEPFNPLVVNTFKLTRIVDMFEGILPPVGNRRVSVAALVLLVLLRMVMLAGQNALNGMPNAAPTDLVLITLFSLAQWLLAFCNYIIIGSIILSWIAMLTQSNPPYMSLITQLAEPILAPIRKLMPDTGAIDFSPIVALMAITLCEKLISAAAHSLGIIV